MISDELDSAFRLRNKRHLIELAANDANLRAEAGSNPRQLCLPGFRDRPRLKPRQSPRVCRWVLRILARTEALERYRAHATHRPALDELLGFEDRSRPLDAEALRRVVGARLEEAEATPDEDGGPLLANLALLARELDLSALECEFLALRAQYWTQPLVNELFERVLQDSWCDEDLARTLAVAFDVPDAEIWRLLDSKGPLFRSGLLRLTTAVNARLPQKLEIQQGLSNALHRPARDLEELLAFAVRVAPAASLGLDDFPHLATETATLVAFLRAATRERMTGVNVLLYGPPGVGKTELSRAIPKAAGLRVFEVPAALKKEDTPDLAERLGRYRMTQGLLGSADDAVVVLDDVDGALPSDLWLPDRSKGIKPWLNELLDSNRLPAFWLANDIGRIDPAYLRRFDLVLEVKTPPRSVRQKILREGLRGLPLDSHWIEAQSADPDVSPAVTARFARVLRTLDEADLGRLQATWAMLSRGRKRALGQRIDHEAATRIADYRPEWLNCDSDVSRLLESLRRRPRGRLLFHGPPGTGKTALAHHLARVVDRPLRVKRASDLLSAWVGGTEKNLVAMFEGAAADEMVLLLDEADSFLQDRGLAQRSWEVTEVNELLTQMDGFDGLFICATNFLQHLDPAALRRFGMKLGFRPLCAEQAMSLFAATYRRLAGRTVTEEEMALLTPELARLANLTPGDVAAAAERWELLDQIPTLTEFVDALQDECAVKRKGGQTIGF